MSSPAYKQLGLGGAGSPITTSHLLLLLLGAGFLALTVFVVHPNDFRLQSFFSGGGRGGGTGCPGGSPTDLHATAPSTMHSSATTTPAASPDDEHPGGGARVLIGIQTMPAKYERRNLLRTVYSLQLREHGPSLAAAVDVRFVLCNVTNPVDAILVSLEILRHNDVLILNCTENMDGGKTYDFFTTAANAFPDGVYDYVMKADDDTYLRLPALATWLSAAARNDAYLGLVMPCDRENFYPFPPFMSGMGYALSWDLVRWIARSETSRQDHVGPEDMWTGRWLNFAGKAKNRYDGGPRMYNYRGGSPVNCFRRDFHPDTIAVHMLKDDRRWAETLAYFNATAALPPSGLYHLP